MRALLIVDLQNDFMPGGPLGVPEGDQVIPVANRTQPKFELVAAGRDWHPPDHGSFAKQHPGHEPGEIIDLHGLDQILWPVHCVQESEGAKFAPGLDTGQIDKVFFKGTEKDIDSYSAFFDNGHRKATGLGDYLKDKGVTTIYVLGLAYEYCVKFSALDACKLGFETFVIDDGCRGIELNEGDIDKAKAQIREAGAKLITSDQV